MQHPGPRVLAVVAAVLVDAGHVLVCRRAPGKTSAGLWEFPGGKIESGETSEAALVREIDEELGILIDVDGLIGCHETSVGHDVIRLTTFWCRLCSERPHASTDHDRLLWLEAAELDQLRWAQPDLPAVSIVAGSSLSS